MGDRVGHGRAADRRSSPPARWRIALAVLAAVIGVGALTLRGGAPVGHFRSGAAADRFARAYDAAMADCRRRT